jgi:CDGSH-type Zn-finger protein
MATIKVRQNGPYVVLDGDVTVVDWNGRAYPVTRTPVALCRCGLSAQKPFCDGSHHRAGFTAGEAAPEPPESPVSSGG